MNDIESEGRCLDHNRDPPGQRSVYIPPGDPIRETYRLATFRDCPPDLAIPPHEFSSNGFYYTGYKDRVKCFSCGQSAENWLATDNVREGKWHLHSCRFFNGIDTSNIPIGTMFPNTRLQQQFSHRPLNPYGFHRPSECNSSNSPLQVRTQNISNSILSPPIQSHALTPNTFERQFPCQNPINPHMRSKESRMQTFLDNIATWPANRIRATPKDIVEAGMFYLGERDRVKCWYCNGGLQNWERDDLPWKEHAKWFPLCEFVLQQKGVAFVEDIVSNYPRITRPTLYNPSTASSATRISQRIGFSTNALTQPIRESSAPIIVDPQEDLRKRNEKIENEIRSSELVSKAKLIGFSESIIREALKRQFRKNKRVFETFESFVNEMLECQKESESSSSPIPSTSNIATNPMTELKRLEDSKKCRLCRRKDACMVFIPCGHLVCCIECGTNRTKCPICEEFIQERVRSYIS